jgi:23S rRNA (adenine2503-C2)-methyltransferase
MGCTFCATGRSGFTSNLSASEILNQLHSISESSLITNVVFMGMGEPFDNADVLFSVLEIMTSSYGYGWSPKRITVSTVGHVDILERFLKESDCHLAISLHSPYSSERVKLVPAERVHPISELLRLIRGYDFFHQRRVSFEYIMFSGINDDTSHAESLLRLLRGIPCRVNLLRYHAIPGVDLRSSELESMIHFRDYLTAHGLMCTLRTSRGEEISAACGMLSCSNKVKRR